MPQSVEVAVVVKLTVRSPQETNNGRWKFTLEKHVGSQSQVVDERYFDALPSQREIENWLYDRIPRIDSPIRPLLMELERLYANRLGR